MTITGGASYRGGAIASGVRVLPVQREAPSITARRLDCKHNYNITGARLNLATVNHNIIKYVARHTLNRRRKELFMNNEELKEAKDLLKMLKSDKWYEEDYTEQALNIIYAYQEDGEFITEDELDDLTRREAEDGAIRVMFFLAHCEPSAPFGYRLNGYANAENATKDDLIWKLEDIIKANEE